MNVFLDLEGTVITNWDEALLLNTSKVREWLKSLKVSQVHLFSFAVWDNKDKEIFINKIKPFLSKALDVNFLDCPSIEDFFAAELSVTGVNWESLHEFITVRGKVDSFRSWCKKHFDCQHNILLDDVVPNAVWEDRDSKLKLEFVNIDSLN